MQAPSRDEMGTRRGRHLRRHEWYRPIFFVLRISRSQSHRLDHPGLSQRCIPILLIGVAQYLEWLFRPLCHVRSEQEREPGWFEFYRVVFFVQG